MRILLLITDLQIGGTPAVVRELAVRLHDPPHMEVEVASLAVRGPVAEQIESRGVRTHSLGAAGLRDIASATGKLLTLAAGFDAMFSFLVHANMLSALVRLGLPRLRLLQSVQTTQPEPRWHWWVQAAASVAAERIVVPSLSVAEACIRWSQIPREKVTVIPNALDLSDLLPASPRPTGRHIGFIGRLDPIKRIPDLLHAMTLLPDATLSIYGEGREKQNLLELRAGLNLESRVEFHGVVPTPWQALGGIDLLALPSAAEGFGLVLIEAMAAGVPVVGSDVPGIRDVVRHEFNGLLVPMGNPAALAAAMRRLLDCPRLRERMIDGGYSQVRERYLWHSVLPRYREVLGC